MIKVVFVMQMRVGNEGFSVPVAVFLLVECLFKKKLCKGTFTEIFLAFAIRCRP